MTEKKRRGLQWRPENLLRPDLPNDYEAALIRRGHWGVCLRISDEEVLTIQAAAGVSLAPPQGVKHRILGPGVLIDPHYALRIATEKVLALPPGFYVSAFSARVKPPHDVGMHLLAPKAALGRFIEARKAIYPPDGPPKPSSSTLQPTPASAGVFHSEDP